VLVRKTLRDVRTATLWIGVAMVLVALLDTLIYPSYREQLQNFQVPQFLRGFLGEAEWASPAGFFQAEFFSWTPLLLITLAIIGATGTLAGEEANGTLDLLLAQPVTRTRVVLEKTIGLTLAVLVAALAAMPGFLLGLLFVDVQVSVVRLLAAVLAQVPLTLIFLTLSLWASAALPTRGAAAAVAIAAVVVTYFLNMLGASVDLLETPRKLSPFSWTDASRVLLHGFREWAAAGVMLAMSIAFLGLAVWSFQRRDIATGAREWRWRTLTSSPSPTWRERGAQRAG
jgi:ABC-2 type transport system permease protein